jgi:RNA polymerase sigma-70 factor (ECF subfamily)
MSAFERADVEGLARLLAAEVVLEMPPMWNWYAGPIAYARFMTRVYDTRGRDWHTVPSQANRQPAMAAYSRQGGRYRLHTFQVFTIERGAIARTTVYQDPQVFTLFELPEFATADGGVSAGRRG